MDPHVTLQVVGSTVTGVGDPGVEAMDYVERTGLVEDSAARDKRKYDEGYCDGLKYAAMLLDRAIDSVRASAE